MDGLPKCFSIVRHFSFTPCGGDHEEALDVGKICFIEAVHVDNRGIEPIVGCHLCCLLCKSSSISCLRTEKNRQGTVTAHHRSEFLRCCTTDCNSGWGGLNRSFSSRCFSSSFCFCTICDKFELDDFNWTCFSCFEDNVGILCSEITGKRTLSFVSIKATIDSNRCKNLRRFIGYFEDFWSDVLTSITGDAIFVNPNLCNDCHLMTSKASASRTILPPNIGLSTLPPNRGPFCYVF